MLIVMTILMATLMTTKTTVNLQFVDANSIRFLVDIFKPLSFENPRVYKECSLSVRNYFPLMESKENAPYLP